MKIPFRRTPKPYDWRREYGLQPGDEGDMMTWMSVNLHSVGGADRPYDTTATAPSTRAWRAIKAIVLEHTPRGQRK